MHPDNIYKNGVSFFKLGEQYTSFQRYLTNGARLNFHDPAALRELTRCLMHRDFNLEVLLPQDRLCPAIPNRLNYLLWLNDLLLDTTDIQAPNAVEKVVTGLDVGTGASCVYPLLGCATFKDWNFIASDIDDSSLQTATNNVMANALSDRIHIQRSSDMPNAKILGLDTWNLERLDFTMCNPPFYSSIDDMIKSAQSKALPPLSACTGTTKEMVTHGGEVEFVSRMIDESRELQDRVRWYTSMVGKLGSISSIVDKLRRHDITNYVIGELDQGNGRTKRWVIGWSFGLTRAGDAIGRQSRSNNLRSYLPFPSQFTIHIPCFDEAQRKTQLQVIKTNLANFFANLPLLFKWQDKDLSYYRLMRRTTILYCNGVGRSQGNVWSRAARRHRMMKTTGHIYTDQSPTAEHGNDIFGFAVMIVLGQAETGDNHTLDDVETSKDNDMWHESYDFGRRLTLQEEEADSVQLDDKLVDYGISVVLRWTYGKDQTVWESFHGCLRREVLKGTQQ